MNEKKAEVLYEGQTAHLGIVDGIKFIMGLEESGVYHTVPNPNPMGLNDKDFLLQKKFISNIEEGYSSEYPNSLEKSAVILFQIINDEIGGWMEFSLYRNGYSFTQNDEVRVYFGLDNEDYIDNPFIEPWDYWFFAAYELIGFEKSEVKFLKGYIDPLGKFFESND